mgnify:CR=1 FL=1
MNEYIITFTSTEEPLTDSTFTQHIVDRTEAAAKKFFNSTAKECRRKFQSIELVRTDAPATKRNERETLEVIRQLVADLGPDSYLATAFEGCFEDAEQNIEFDWGCSQKRLADAAAEKVKELEAKVKELEEKLRQEIAEKQQARDEAQKAIRKLEAKTLSDEDLEAVASILEGQVEEAEELAEKAAAEIVRFAEAPALPEFTAAVSKHRNHTAHAKSLRELLGKVDAIRANNHAGA